MITRRQSLRILGLTTLAGGAAIGSFALTRTPSAALEPWSQAGTDEDPRLYALSYAVLAPNPHNRQPWLVALDTPETITVYLDRERDLPHTDPHSRQITIGLGCFLELMAIGASRRGYTVDFNLYPDGEDGLVAIATFTQGASTDPLFNNIVDRRSCKEPFKDMPVPQDMVLALNDYATVITGKDPVKRIQEITWQAWQIEAQTSRTLKESVDLMRFGKQQINANPDGINLGGFFLESLMVSGILDKESLLDPNSSNSIQAAQKYESMLRATPAYAVITSMDNDRVSQLKAGRQWLRLNLKTTAIGLSLHPVSQALQEFDEMKSPYQQIHQLLAEPGQTVQMLGRLGFGPSVSPTPRWPYQTRIIQKRDESAAKLSFRKIDSDFTMTQLNKQSRCFRARRHDNDG